MKAFLLLVLTVFSVAVSTAQIHEFGGFIGGSNFIGDVGATNYINPSKLTIGGLYRWNRSPRHSYRISVLFTELQADDSKSDDPRRKERGYKFSNNIIEISAGMEFTFFDFDLHTGKPMATPYLYTGISVAYHDNFYFNQAGAQTSEDTSSFAYGIPMAIGFKASVFEKLIIGAEIGARYTFSDELDGSVPDSKNLKDTFSFGNTNNNDWYMFTGIMITYTFGRNPCYCVYK